MILAKIPIPFILFVHPAPWVYALIATVVVGVMVFKFAEGGQVDPAIGGPALLFLYSSYHMVGAMFTGFGPIFGLGALGSVGSVGFVLFLMKSRHAEHAQMLADEPERLRQLREDGVNNIIHNIGCTRAEAEEYMDRFNGDDTKVVIEARAGRLNLPSAPEPKSVAVSSDQNVSAKLIPGPPFDKVNGYALLQASSGPKDYSKWSKLLASVCELVAIDAMQKMRAHRGAVIISELKDAVADSFMKLLENEGVEVIKIPLSQMMKFASAGQVKALDYDEATLKIVDHSERVYEVELESLMLLAVGVFGAANVMTGPDGMVDANRGHVGADLFVLGEEENLCYQFALDVSRLSYAHLGDRKAARGMENLQLTLGDLVSIAPGMAVNPSVQAFVQEGRARHFKTSQDYGGEVTGLAQLIQARRLLKGS